MTGKSGVETPEKRLGLTPRKPVGFTFAVFGYARIPAFKMNDRTAFQFSDSKEYTK